MFKLLWSPTVHLIFIHSSCSLCSSWTNYFFLSEGPPNGFNVHKDTVYYKSLLGHHTMFSLCMTNMTHVPHRWNLHTQVMAGQPKLFRGMRVLLHVVCWSLGTHLLISPTNPQGTLIECQVRQWGWRPTTSGALDGVTSSPLLDQ